MIKVVSLLNAEGLQRIVTGLVTNFTSFAPLGTVLVAMLGVAVAEHSGMLSTAMRALVMNASKRMVTVTIVFAAIVSNTASELGYVVLIPLAAMIFHSLGRHPLAGLAAAFAGVSGGYSANLLLGTVDPLLSGITESAAHLLNPEYEVGPEVNWYFMVISTFVIAFAGAWVTEKIVEPRLGEYSNDQASIDLGEQKMDTPTAAGNAWIEIRRYRILSGCLNTWYDSNTWRRYSRFWDLTASGNRLYSRFAFLKRHCGIYLFIICYCWFCLRPSRRHHEK